MGEHQEIAAGTLQRKSTICSVGVVVGVKILRFPYPFIYLNL